MPGTYSVRVAVPGVANAADGQRRRRSRSAAEVQRSRSRRASSNADANLRMDEDARRGATSARALVAQRDSIEADFAAGGAADGRARADSLNARIAAVSADVDRAFTAVNGQRAPIEAWSGLPSVDQRKSLGYAIEDAEKAVAELNTLVSIGHSGGLPTGRKEGVATEK